MVMLTHHTGPQTHDASWGKTARLHTRDERLYRTIEGHDAGINLFHKTKRARYISTI